MKRPNIVFSALDFIEDKLVGFDSISNGFIDIELSEGQWKFGDCFFLENKDTCFGKPFVTKNEIWFPPCNSDITVTISEKGVSQYLIHADIGIPHRFSSMFIHNENAIFIPGCGSGIVLHHLNTAKERIIDNWVKEYEKLAFKGHTPARYGKSRYGQYLLMDEKIWIPLLHAPAVLEVDLETNSSSIHRIQGGDETGFLAIYGDKNRQFLLTRSTAEILEVEKDVVIHRFELNMKETMPGLSLERDGTIYVLGLEKAVLKAFDRKNRKMEHIDLSNVLESAKNVDFGAFIQNENLLYIFENKNGSLISIDVKERQASANENVIQIDDVSLVELMRKKVNAGHILEESDFFTLENFIRMNH